MTHASVEHMYLLILLAKLEVGYGYKSYSIASLFSPGMGPLVPDGAIHLPIIDLKAHYLVLAPKKP